MNSTITSSIRPILVAFYLVITTSTVLGADSSDAEKVLSGLRSFYQKTARADGSFQPGIDPDYLGMSDSAYSDLAAVTYAVTIHKTFGWELPFETQTIQWLLARQRATGEFFNVGGTVDPLSPQGRTYNTTQALVALRALGVPPGTNPLGVFEEILKQDYKALPAYSTSFFPLAYLCYGQPIPPQADRAIRALMVSDENGYLNDHVAATFHASHYHQLIAQPTPKSAQMVTRILRDQKSDGSWFLNMPSRDRHATFDAVFTLRHEGQGRKDCQEAIARAAQWALACRNSDGGFGHFPGSTSDADAVYFQVGTLVMAGYLVPANPIPRDPHLLSWGHLMPVRSRSDSEPTRLALAGWVGAVAIRPDSQQLATGSSDHAVQIWSSAGARVASLTGHTDAVASLAYAPSGEALVSGSHDGTAKIWDVRAQQLQQTLVGHAGAVTSVAYAPAGKAIATASLDQSIRIWDQAGKHERTLNGHKSWVNSVAFSANGEWLVSGSSDGTVKVWQSATGELLKSLTATNAEVRSVAVSHDSKVVAAGCRYGRFKVWKTDDWRELRSWEIPSDDAWSVTFSADDRQLITTAGEWNRPSTIVRWDLENGERVAEFGHPGEVLCVAASNDGSFLAAGGADRTMSIWRLRSKQ